MDVEPNLVLWLIVLLLVFFATLVVFCIHSGLFAPIDVKAIKPPFQGPLQVAYKFARGPYKNAGQLFTEVHSLIPELKTFGVYYDDPHKVNSSDLRYCVGVILSDDGSEPKAEHVQALKEHDYKQISFPAVEHCVLTTFPYKSTISIVIAVARVYPKLADYIEHHKLCAHPMIEIYDNGEIIFMAPLSRQDEFYVPETQEEALSDEILESHDEAAQNTDAESVNERVQEEETSSSARVTETQPAVLQVNGPVEGDEDEESSVSSFEEVNREDSPEIH